MNNNIPLKEPKQTRATDVSRRGVFGVTAAVLGCICLWGGLLAVPTTAMAADFRSMVVFGDSNSDTGNLYRATKRKNPPRSRYYNGRFSNGPLWIEYVRSKLRIPVRVEAYGGARSGYGGGRGLRRQVDNYIAKRRGRVDPRTLFFIWVGANDAEQLAKGKSEYAVSRQATNHIATAVAQIASAGGRIFAVANMANLGKTPIARSDRRISPSQLTRFSRRFNSDLRRALRPIGQSVKIVDVYPLLGAIQARPKRYGLSDARKSCLAIKCREPNRFLFLDGKHLTTQGHRQLANYIMAKL